MLLFYIINRSAAVRRRQEDKHRLRYQPVTDLNQISRPSKPYQIYDIDSDRTQSSNNKLTKPSSSITTNIIRPGTREKSISDNSVPIRSSIKKDESSVTLTESKEQ
jgi:hypothetical protein